MLRSQIEAFVEVIRNALSSIGNVIQKHEAAVHDAAEAANQKQRDIAVFIVDAIERLAGTVPDYEQAQRDKEYKLQKRIFWITVIGTLVAAAATVGAWYYAIAAARQTSIMQKTYRQIQKQTYAAKKAATAAQSAAKTAKEQMIVGQRAWVGLKDATCAVCTYSLGAAAKPGETVYESLRHLRGSISLSDLEGDVINTGKTPAEDVQVAFELHYGAVKSACGSKDISACLYPILDIRRFKSGNPRMERFRTRHPTERLGVIVPEEARHIVFESGTTGGGTRTIGMSDKPSVYGACPAAS